MTQITDWDVFASRVDAARYDDNALLVHPWHEWYEGSFAHTLRTAVAVMKEYDIQVDMDQNEAHSSRSCQHHIYQELRLALHPPNLEALMRRRLKRWAKTEETVTKWCNLADSCAVRITCLKKIVPPCVLAALARTWLNGWCTARRFQGEARCRLHELCDGDDSLEHYAQCKTAWLWLERRARFKVENRSLARFFVLKPHENDCPVLLAVNLYAVYSTINFFRSQGNRGKDEEAYHLMEERWAFVEQLCPKLHSYLAARW
eukprot:1215445-Karenia_brevis.AAC.1